MTKNILLVTFTIVLVLSFSINVLAMSSKNHTCEAPCRIHFSGPTEEDDVFWDWEGHKKSTAYIFKGRH